MKLWHSNTSPYVRKVMAVIKYHQLENQIELHTIQSSLILIHRTIKIIRLEECLRYNWITVNGCITVM